MMFLRLRFALALAAFVGWLLYLLFLVQETRHPIVLSRPQFLVSTLDAVAEVDNTESGQVQVLEIHWPRVGPPDLVDKTVIVTNLAECKEDWTGPGKYILPLVPHGKNYRVAPLPRSPGFSSAQRPRIYPATSDTLRQLEEIHKAAERK